RAVVQLCESPASSLVPQALWESKIAILSDGSGLAERLAELLFEVGVVAEIATEVDSGYTGLIDLRPLRQVADPDSAEEMVFQSFLSAKHLSHAPSVYIVVQQLDGAFGFERALGAQAYASGVGGILRCAAVEWSDCYCKLIDIEISTPETAAIQLFEEICFGGSETEVSLSDGRRRTIQTVDHSPEPQISALREGDVVVVSGGGRGVTAHSVIALARHTKARFLLLGRTVLEKDPCPQAHSDAEIKRALLAVERVSPKELGRWTKHVLACREIEHTLAQLRDIGVEARYLSLDVTDSAGVAGALDSIRQTWGPIAGIIHGAGVLADKRIADKELSDFQWVYRVKVHGMRALLDACTSDPLRFLCFYSSVAARSGNQGQSDYAAANEVLNKMALNESRNRPNCVVKSLGWGPWAGGMVSPALERHFSSMGVSLIGIDDGAQALVYEACEPAGVEIILGHSLLPRKESAELSVLVEPERYAYLRDHAIDGGVIVPIAQVIEWFVRAVQSFDPLFDLSGLRDIRVLKGLKLGAFDKASLYTLSLKREESGIQIQLLDRQRLCYSALAVEGSSIPSLGSKPSGRPVDEIYRGPLFHGPYYQVLSRVSALGKMGVEADLIDIAATGQTNPLAVDAALQLALLWTEECLESNSVPMRIAEFSFRDTAITSCRLEGVSSTNKKAKSNAFLLSETGEVAAALIGVETYRIGLAAGSRDAI
ncbi:MAG: SDR family NAD(P)-dependent oxidoreductase, partial [Myxococcota bacterium]|nr:SDR family NAD(P)-dependent oxidoreductase [Myxococcota bacterium]